jgi:hypothetical protein
MPRILDSAHPRARRGAAPLRRLAASLVAAMALAAPAGAAPGDTEFNGAFRPISDFLNAQGTFDLGVLFLPPVPNFFGWTDPVDGLALTIDYAGLADATCDGVAGTTFAGRVLERHLPNGRARVTVVLVTAEAITFAVKGFDFANDPVVFGARWTEDEQGACAIGAAPALGYSILRLTFHNTAPGAPLPDLFQLVIAPEPGQELLDLSLHAVALGALPDGRPARATAHQEVRRNRAGDLEFVVEEVGVQPLGVQYIAVPAE